MFLLQRLGFWGRQEVHKEFDEDNCYVGLANNRPPLSFCDLVNYHKGYMLILRPRDETYAKSVWVARTLYEPNIITSSLHF